MSAALIAVIVALALGHLAPSLAAGLRDYGWFAAWVRWLDARLPGAGAFWQGRYGVALALLPPLLAVGLFQLALDEPLLGLAGLLFGIIVLFYCWGPRDLDIDVESVLSASDADARRGAAAHLWPAGTRVAPALDAPALVGAVFSSARRRWFGVLFWFLVLGPVGAALYRFAAEAAVGAASERLPAGARSGARWLHALLDWPVGQLMTLALALVADFDSVVGAWKDNGGADFRLDAPFLEAAGRVSVKSELADEALDYVEDGVSGQAALAREMGELPELRDAMSLVWRCLLVWLAVLALFVLAGYVA